MIPLAAPATPTADALDVADQVRASSPWDAFPGSLVLYGINLTTGVISQLPTGNGSDDHRATLRHLPSSSAAKTVARTSDVLVVSFQHPADPDTRLMLAADRDGNTSASLRKRDDTAAVPVGSYAGMDADAELVRRMLAVSPYDPLDDGSRSGS
jgi:hypothetical protein